MRTNKFLLAFFILTFGWLTSFAAFAIDQSNPTAMLQGIADNMIAGLKSNKATLKSNPKVVYRLAYSYVVPYAALPEMSKAVLPPSVWNSATPAQRQQFQRNFTNTLIRTYASALTSYQDQSVRFFPIRGGSQGKSYVTVDSEISGSSGQPIRVSYQLIRAGGVWKLYDMSVEGVDMLESFRAQYADILSSGSMDQLLQRMSSHNAR